MNSTLLTSAMTRNGIMVFIQKVASTVAEAAYPSRFTQSMVSLPSNTSVERFIFDPRVFGTCVHRIHRGHDVVRLQSCARGRQEMPPIQFRLCDRPAAFDHDTL